MKITIAHLYPDLLNLYGDRGNIECLQKRCLWRDIEVEIINLTINDQLTPEILEQIDIMFMGGGEDCAQKKLYNDFVENKGTLIKQYIESDGVGLFICGGYQILGNYYRPYSGKDIKGLGIMDLYTRHYGRDKKRCVGNVVCSITGINYLKNKTLVGFENHGGRTYLEDTKPLAKIKTGHGNNDTAKNEGVIYKNIIGTYLHGPILPKNPHLADWLIKTALEKQTGGEVEITPLDDELEWQAHKQALKLDK